MGVSVDNVEGGPHVSGGALQGFFLRLHRGDQGIDTRSPDCTPAQWHALQGAALLEATSELDRLGAETWPQWWPQWVHARPGGLQAVKLLLSL